MQDAACDSAEAGVLARQSRGRGGGRCWVSSPLVVLQQLQDGQHDVIHVAEACGRGKQTVIEGAGSHVPNMGGQSQHQSEEAGR